MTDLIKLLLFEIIKVLKQPIHYFFVFIIVAPTMILQAGMSSYLEKPMAINDAVFIPMQTTINTILPFIILFFSANIFASEIKYKTIRSLLSHNSRGKVFIAKTCTVAIYVGLLLTLIFVTSFLGYLLLNNFKIVRPGCGIDLFVWHFIGMLSLTYLSLFAVASFGILLSCFFNNNISAISIGIGSYILIECIKTQLRIDKYIITSYFEKPMNMFTAVIEGYHSFCSQDIINFTVIVLCWVTIPLALSFFIFRNKDIQ